MGCFFEQYYCTIFCFKFQGFLGFFLVGACFGFYVRLFGWDGGLKLGAWEGDGSLKLGRLGRNCSLKLGRSER